jgi:hypothetical protein
VQAQDLPGALHSVALRTADRRLDSVRAALDRGQVVRSWPMRGTLHLVPAEDLGWMLALTGRRQHAAAVRRRAQLGLDDAIVAAARDIAMPALADGGRLIRGELTQLWDRAGIPTTDGRGYHLIYHLAAAGDLCFGPMRGKEPEIVAVSAWIADPRPLDRDSALQEWALRFFAGHGPATPADFTRWTKLTAAESRIGVTAARPDLARLTVDDVEYLMHPETPDLLARHQRSARATHLLPGFDELVLGYADRSATIPAEFAARIVPGGNGVFRPTVIHDGSAVATWRRDRKGDIVAEPFTALPADVALTVGVD